MNGKTSRIAEKISSKYSKRIYDINISGKSMVGEKFTIDGKSYIVTNGDIDLNIDKIKNNILNKIINHEKKN